MASTALTILEDYRVSYQNRLDKNETRPKLSGALDLHMKQTRDEDSIWTPETLSTIENSFLPGINVPVINFRSVTIGNTRSCAVQTGGPVSALVGLTATTYTYGFQIPRAAYTENSIGYESLVNAAIKQGLVELKDAIDADAVNNIEANVNQVTTAATDAIYTQTANAYQVPDADSQTYFNKLQDIAAILNYSDWGGDYLVSPGLMNEVRFAAQQGQSNDQNTAFQFDAWNYYRSNNVPVTALASGTGYFILPGSVAVHSRVDPSARNNDMIHESKYWTTFTDAPLLNMDLGVYYQADCTDAAAIDPAFAGMEASKLESWQFSVDVFYGAVYNSNPATIANPILKFDRVA